MSVRETQRIDCTFVIQVKVEALNDSQLIGTCIYNVVILSLLGVGLGMVLSEEVHLMAALNGVFTLLATFCTQLIIFLPKVGENRIQWFPSYAATLGERELWLFLEGWLLVRGELYILLKGLF